jgi:hypothetical protein
MYFPRFTSASRNVSLTGGDAASQSAAFCREACSDGLCLLDCFMSVAYALGGHYTGDPQNKCKTSSWLLKEMILDAQNSGHFRGMPVDASVYGYHTVAGKGLSGHALVVLKIGLCEFAMDVAASRPQLGNAASTLLFPWNDYTCRMQAAIQLGQFDPFTNPVCRVAWSGPGAYSPPRPGNGNRQQCLLSLSREGGSGLRGAFTRGSNYNYGAARELCQQLGGRIPTEEAELERYGFDRRGFNGGQGCIWLSRAASGASGDGWTLSLSSGLEVIEPRDSSRCRAVCIVNGCGENAPAPPDQNGPIDPDILRINVAPALVDPDLPPGAPAGGDAAAFVDFAVALAGGLVDVLSTFVPPQIAEPLIAAVEPSWSALAALYIAATGDVLSTRAVATQD